MGKRSDFERKKHDFYPTPAAAVVPLLPHLPPRTRFIEPCAGDGSLVRHLEGAGHFCIHASDIHPTAPGVEEMDALAIPKPAQRKPVIITNPPWGSEVLEPMLDHFLKTASETWLLLYSDWLFNRGTVRFIRHAAAIVAIGRVKWIPDSRFVGKENCAWVMFQRRKPSATLFFNERK